MQLELRKEMVFFLTCRIAGEKEQQKRQSKSNKSIIRLL